ncbi:MAG: radical SAM protein [Candidatus Omnitrophica bacterium]|nr:radical SAM protein [Candidatus Omnitrophota bacterium]
MKKAFRKAYDFLRNSKLGLAVFSIFSFLLYIPMFGRRNTYCSLLWDSVYIDAYGHVFPCCHVRPGMVGDISKDNLRKIWSKSISLRFFRFTSCRGCLYCANNCDMLPFKHEQKPVVRPIAFAGHPSRLWIMYGELCNVSCVMCHQDHRSKVKIDNNFLKLNIDWSVVKEVQLQGGEVLLMQGAKELYSWLTKDMGKKVNVITNGLLLNDEWVECLVTGASWVAISVNAATAKMHEKINRGSNFDKVVKNIKKMITVKRELHSDTKIIFKYTIVPENVSEIVAAVALADSLGCDSLQYGYDSRVPLFLHNNKKIAQEIKRSLSVLLDGGNVKVNVPSKNLVNLGLLDHDDRISNG